MLELKSVDWSQHFFIKKCLAFFEIKSRRGLLEGSLS